MIPEFRQRLNREFSPKHYSELLKSVELACGVPTEFRIAETPVFLPLDLLESLAADGAAMTQDLLGDSEYLAAARRAIPSGYQVAAETPHPHFFTADFALVRTEGGALEHRLVEIQAFPSVFGYQDALSSAYRQTFELGPGLGSYLSGLDEAGYWELLRKTIVGKHNPENVVLTEIDPQHQKTLPDFNVTARRLGIAVVDIRALEPVGNKLHYRSADGRLIPIHRIYNRAIADELIARKITLPFDLEKEWDVEWAGHPNWYFLISKFSIPWLSKSGEHRSVPPAVFVDDFLEGSGRRALESAGVSLPQNNVPETVFSELLLKPLFSFAGKGILFDPTLAQLEAIPPEQRKDFLLQQRMQFERTIETPHGPTQAEIRILYAWPDGGELTPALSLVRLGRGKMMGVDHNKNQEWVGASAAFYPKP